MIYKNEDNVNIIEMGTGDIEVAFGVTTTCKSPCVAFTQQENKDPNIGEISKQALKKYGSGRTTRIDTHTMLVFTDPRSVNVVIEHLQNVLKYLTQRGK